MKKFLIVAALLFSVLCFSQVENVQEKPWSFSTGIILAPQAGLDLKESKNGVTNQTNLFATVSASKGNSTLVGFYSVKNSIGLVYLGPIKGDFGWYGVALKGVVENFNYAGIGGTYSLGKNSIFIEFGSSLDAFTPGIYVGVFIPFTVKLK
ncbi:hypothetical protein KC929_01760 [Patescibacteria group bacterium]|nr:hypothetical protein [Patescibacteria group bacterium]